MAEDLWKEYESNKLTHSAAHYLRAVNELLDEQGYARVVDVARRLNITRGSCSIGLKALKRRGLIVEDGNKFLSLSEEGRRLAEIVELNAELLESFLHSVLGVEKEQAEIDACKMEHLISIDSSMKLYAFMNFVKHQRPTVSTFLSELNTFMTAPCKGDTETCQLCKSVCVLKHDQEEDA